MMQKAEKKKAVNLSLYLLYNFTYLTLIYLVLLISFPMNCSLFLPEFYQENYNVFLSTSRLLEIVEAEWLKSALKISIQQAALMCPRHCYWDAL